MRPDWTPLTQELARWEGDGLKLPLWWRDDDATAQTPPLDQLRQLATALALPVHLAIIPADLDPSLPPVVHSDIHLVPLVHGWAHHSHAPSDQKKAEFGDHRPARQCLDEAARALATLRPLLAGAPAIFVPPWNRIAPGVTDGLADLGYAALSTFLPRRAPQAAPGLAQINTHLDPINWRGDRSLVPPDQLIAQIVQQLSDRRQGRADNDEPYGILTHHLVHDPAIWQFTQDLLTRLLDGPARPWHQRALPERTPT